MPQITERLHEDHQKVEKLLQKLKDTGSGAEKTRTQLCEQLVHELQAHTEFEEKVFYPAVRKAGKNAESEVETAIEEHDEVESMLERLQAMEPTSDDFVEVISELEEAIQAHVSREEKDIFPLAERTIEDEDSSRMTEEHDQMVEKHMQRAAS